MRSGDEAGVVREEEEGDLKSAGRGRLARQIAATQLYRLRAGLAGWGLALAMSSGCPSRPCASAMSCEAGTSGARVGRAWLALPAAGRASPSRDGAALSPYALFPQGLSQNCPLKVHGADYSGERREECSCSDAGTPSAVSSRISLRPCGVSTKPGQTVLHRTPRSRNSTAT